MTTQERKRDIKRLAAAINSMPSDNDHLIPYFQFIDNYAKAEFIRLHNADNSFKNLDAKSLLLLIGMNRKHRFIEFHKFGLNVEYTDYL